MPLDTTSHEAIIPDAAGRRLSNQIARTYRGTYGARTGLRSLVRSVSVQMLRAGSSPDAVARALVNHAVSCPAPASVGPATARKDVLHSSALAALVMEYVYAPEVDPTRLLEHDGRHESARERRLLYPSG